MGCLSVSIMSFVYPQARLDPKKRFGTLSKKQDIRQLSDATSIDSESQNRVNDIPSSPRKSYLKQYTSFLVPTKYKLPNNVSWFMAGNNTHPRQCDPIHDRVEHTQTRRHANTARHQHDGVHILHNMVAITSTRKRGSECTHKTSERMRTVSSLEIMPDSKHNMAGNVATQQDNGSTDKREC